MRELEYTFSGKGEVKGSVFTMIIACGHGYVYQVDTTGYDNKGRKIQCKPHYEVFKRKENRRFNSVAYPKSKHFGVWAWTATNKRQAFQIFFSKVYPKKV